MAKKREAPEINASSMADIAFLLLIFFLVTTTMDVDKGIVATLPPWAPDQPEVEVDINARNVLEILVNKHDQLLVEGELTEIRDLKGLAMKHVNNNGKDPDFSLSPDKAVVSLKNDKGTSYNRYIEVYNELRAAYNTVRNEYAQQKYGRPYVDLEKADQKAVREVYPLKLSEAEPTDFSAEGQQN